MNKISKKEVVEVVATELDMTQVEVKRVLDTALDKIKDYVAGGDAVDLSGFGKIEPRERAARNGVNPATKEKILIPATTAVGFKPAKAFKDYVAGK